MTNFIQYFYNIKIDNIYDNKKFYCFYYNNYLYRLYIYDENNNLDFIYNLCNNLSNITLISIIIKNKFNQIITNYNNINYVLIKFFANVNKNITLEEITYLDNSYNTSNIKNNWGLLWSNKIDYLEQFILENGKKYPLIVDSFNYYVGMAENAISYYNEIDTSLIKSFISHKKIRINDKIDVIYNPLNIILDYRVRDIAEYIKISFFNNNKNIYNELNNYLRKSYLSINEVMLLIARLLYPSFYFELYEDILIDNKDEKIIQDYISNTNEYEEYLSNIIKYFRNIYDIPTVDWLNKKWD